MCSLDQSPKGYLYDLAQVRVLEKSLAINDKGNS